MSSTGVLQPDGTVCRTGPSCRRHGDSGRAATLAADIRNLLTPTEPAYKKYLPGLTREQYVAFTQGDCWLLAKAVKERTGYPIIAAGSDDNQWWCHMGNLAPDGSVWDANGRHENAAAFLSGWEKILREDLDEGHIPTTWVIPDDESWRDLTSDQDRFYEEHEPEDVAHMIAEAAERHAKA